MSVKLMSAIFETEFRDLIDAEGNVTKGSTAKLVLLALADHANDDGEGAYPGLTKMELKTALSRQAIINTYDALKYNGVIFLAGISKRNTNNYTINTKSFPGATDGSQPTLLVNPLDSGSQPTLLEVVNPLDSNHPLTVNEPSRETPKNMPIDWYIQHNLPVPPELTKSNSLEAEALHEFESAFGFNQLPWDTTSDWQAFKKWVVKIYQSAPADFRDYVEWRGGKGKYDAMSNKQIRLTPRAFMDTGYPTFKASAMYAKKTDETRPEYKPYKPEEKNYVPRPATIKPVIRKPAE